VLLLLFLCIVSIKDDIQPGTFLVDCMKRIFQRARAKISGKNCGKLRENQRGKNKTFPFDPL